MGVFNFCHEWLKMFYVKIKTKRKVIRMKKDYTAIHYIQSQVEKYYHDSRISNVLVNCLNAVCRHEESDGCADGSAALYVCLRNLGYKPEICFGLCTTDKKIEIYHIAIPCPEKQQIPIRTASEVW